MEKTDKAQGNVTPMGPDRMPVPKGFAWPCVDGEPVLPGDRLWHRETGLESKVVTVTAFEDGSVSAELAHGYCRSSDLDSEYTRTESSMSVYDREGVEIEVGDTVYLFGDSGTPYKVVNPRDGMLGGTVMVSRTEGHGETNTWFVPESLTHEGPRKPVLDRYGVEIKVGDTVYLARGNEKPREVVCIHPGFCRSIECETDDGFLEAIRPKDLAHKHPCS
jgi:hypothetical protein